MSKLLRRLWTARPHPADRESLAAPAAQIRPMALEQRFMFDAAAVFTVATDTTVNSTDPSAAAGTADMAGSEHNTLLAELAALADLAPPALAGTVDAPVLVRAVDPSQNSGRREAVFIDTSLANYQALVDGVKPGVEVLLLDAGQDGLAQMALWAQSSSGYDAIHVLSHGTPGSIQLGSVALDGATLGSYSTALAQLGAALTASGDLLIYGCDVAGIPAGLDLIAALAAATGADVAASVDVTGASVLGGDWVLEARVGSVEAEGMGFDYADALSTSITPVIGTTYFNANDGNAVVIDDSISVNTQTWYGEAYITISENFRSDQDVLVFTPNAQLYDDIEGAYNASTGVLRLTSQSFNPSPANWQAALRSITYDNTSAAPDGSTRTVTFQLNDLENFNDTWLRTVALITSAPPTISEPSSEYTYPAEYSGGDNESGLPVLVDPAITVSVSGSTTLASATVSITGNFDGSQDVLAAVYDYGYEIAIASVYNSATGVLTFTATGETTLQDWQNVLQAVLYSNTAAVPGTATRTVSYVVNDGYTDSAVATRTVTVIAVEQSPVVTTSGGTAAFTAGNNVTSTPVVIDSGLTVSDRDSSTLSGANVYFWSGYQGSADQLAFTNTNSTQYGDISSFYSPYGTRNIMGDSVGILTLYSAGGTATLAQWQAALRAVTFTNTEVTPQTGNRVIAFRASDGTNQSLTATRTVTVTATPQTPVVATSGGSASFTAGDNTVSTPVTIDSGLTVSDLDSATLASVTVSITGNFNSGEDLLSFTNNSATHGNIGATYNAATGVLTLSSSGATATLAQWQSALRSVRYLDTAVTPNTATRTISFVANDGSSNSTIVTRNVTVTATDQSPIVINSGGTTAFTAADGVASTPVVIDSAITLSDLDNSTLATATVTIASGFQTSEDSLSFTNDGSTQGNIFASYNAATGVLTLSSAGATATVAQWQSALRSVVYANSATLPNTASRTVAFVVNDGTKDSAVSTKLVTVTAVNQTPYVTTSGGSAAFTAGDNVSGTPVTVDSGITLADGNDSTLAVAIVSISSNFQAGQDALGFTNTNAGTFGNISADYNSGTGVMTLTSAGATATLSQWQAALRAVTYANSTPTPVTATRTISYVINDGMVSSLAGTRNVTVTGVSQTPVLATSALGLGMPGSIGFQVGPSAVPVAVDPGLAVIDGDSSTLASATVAITGNFQAALDVLAFTNDGITQGNISGSYDENSGVLTLTSAGATATLAEWQSALRAVTYAATGALAQTSLRTVSFVVSDGSLSSAAVTRQISVSQAIPDSVPVMPPPPPPPAPPFWTGGSPGLPPPPLFDLPSLGAGIRPVGNIFINSSALAPSFIAQVFASSDTGGAGAGTGFLGFGGGDGGVFGSSTFGALFGGGLGGGADSTALGIFQTGTSGAVDLGLGSGLGGSLGGTPGAGTSPSPNAPALPPPTPSSPTSPVLNITAPGSLPAPNPLPPVLASPLSPPLGAGPGSADPGPGLLSIPLTGGAPAESTRPLTAIPDLGDFTIRAGQAMSITVPANTFTQSDRGAGVTVEARQTNGSPLPAWMRFNPSTGTLAGTPPPGYRGNINVELIARDSRGNVAVTTLQISTGLATPPGPGAGGVTELQGPPGSVTQIPNTPSPLQSIPAGPLGTAPNAPRLEVQ